MKESKSINKKVFIVEMLLDAKIKSTKTFLILTWNLALMSAYPLKLLKIYF